MRQLRRGRPQTRRAAVDTRSALTMDTRRRLGPGHAHHPDQPAVRSGGESRLALADPRRGHRALRPHAEPLRPRPAPRHRHSGATRDGRQGGVHGTGPLRRTRRLVRRSGDRGVRRARRLLRAPREDDRRERNPRARRRANRHGRQHRPANVERTTPPPRRTPRKRAARLRRPTRPPPIRGTNQGPTTPPPDRPPSTTPKAKSSARNQTAHHKPTPHSLGRHRPARRHRPRPRSGRRPDAKAARRQGASRPRL